MLVTLEHGACDSGSCLHALSVSLGDLRVQLRDSGNLGPASTGHSPGLLPPLLPLSIFSSHCLTALLGSDTIPCLNFPQSSMFEVDTGSWGNFLWCPLTCP